MTSLFGNTSVDNTAEVRRIASLPRRVWSEEEGIRLAASLTRELKKSRGTMALRPVQAIALYEAMENGGGLYPIRVGGGKSLLSLLLGLILEARWPILILPAALIEKTVGDRRRLSEHWHLPTNLEMISYEMLGRVQSSKYFEYRSPDLIIADEAHRAKNRRAGVTRRLIRYMREAPTTKFCGMSGTIMKQSIHDFAHILRWALKDKAPIPHGDEEVSAWAEAIDEKVNPLARRRPGALLTLGPRPPGVDDLTAARRIFQSRLLETPGVVASSRTDGVTCSLRVSALEYQPAPVTEQHFRHVRGSWSTPDGWNFSEAIELRRYLRELATGFHGVWDPRPPSEWRAARKAWASFVRETLGHSRSLDTELQVANAVDAGHLHDEGVLAAWREEKPTFTIQPKPLWHDRAALLAAEAWMKREKGIVWTESVFFAKSLAQMTGAAYYGAHGQTEAGESITHVKPGRAIIASVAANSTGQNLQMFSSNLIISCPSGPATMEQLIGRTHRDGQEADEVSVDILLGCVEHYEAFTRALDGAKAAADVLGHDQKLLLADVTMPDISGRRGPLWGDDGVPCKCNICLP